MTHKVTLRTAPHTRTEDTVVEIWDGNRMIGVIYPAPRGIKVISKYIENRPDLLLVEPDEPPAILVNLIAEESR